MISKTAARTANVPPQGGHMGSFFPIWGPFGTPLGPMGPHFPPLGPFWHPLGPQGPPHGEQVDLGTEKVTPLDIKNEGFS